MTMMRVSYTINSFLLGLGALLYLIPYVLGTQANAVCRWWRA